MKTSELLPQELVRATVNLITGKPRPEDYAFFRDQCGLDITCLWFCEDSSFEVELNDGSLIDIHHVEKSQSYLQSAFLLLLDELGGQLPEWVYDGDKFCFNWGSHDASLEEFDAAYQRVWDYVFDGQPLNYPPSALESAIHHTMTSELQPQESLPNWMKISGYSSVCLSREFLTSLANVRRCFGELPPVCQVSSEESYVSPFTGKLC